MWKTILVGYDGSEHSKDALSKAEKIAEQGNSKILIVNVYREMITKSFSLGLLEEAEETLDPGLEVEKVSARNTDVVEELLEIAEVEGSDLVVVGSRGMGEVASVLLGSVSQGVATGSEVDVLITHK